MKNAKYITAIFVVFLFADLMLSGHVVYAGVAGNVQFVNGSVHLTSAAAQSHALQKGDAINENDTVSTAKGSSAQIRMRDGGFIVIRPESQLKFDSFIFNGEEDGSERSFFSLIKGGIRAITGLIGQQHKSNYKIFTVNATIAIRGTDHETYVVVPGSPLANVAPPGTYNKVNTGETAIATGKGTLPLLPNQMGFAGAIDQMPQLQPVNLNIFTVTPAPLVAANTAKAQVREGAVVDSDMRAQDVATDNGLPKKNIQIPVTGSSGGKSAIPIVF